MSTPEQAALVLERLLIDAAFRADFRAAPAQALERHGMHEMAERMRRDARALQTLELRESRSSLAGVMMAAAVEGVALFHAVAHQARPLDGEAADAVRQALERPAVRRLTTAMPAAHAQSVPDPGAGASPPAGSAGTAPPQVPAGGGAAVDPPEVPAGAAPGTAPPVDPACGTPPADVPLSSGSTAAPSNPAGSMPAVTGAPSASARTGAAVAARLDRSPPAAHAHHADAGAHADHDVPDDAIVPYPGDDASRAAIAQWMAAAARRAGLPPELPVMAALQESGLRNLEGGDADSAGFFQMRVSVWDKGAYRGYRDRADVQLKWFIDQALREKAAHPELAGSPQRYGEWIADVERPLAAYRDRYQPHLDEARGLLRHAHPAAHAADAAADGHADADGAAARTARRLLSVAAHELGVSEHPPGSNDGPRIAQYREAGPAAGVGPWCAYFVSWTAEKAGVPLGDHGFASVDALWAWAQQSGHAVPTGRPPKPGDLIVWDEHVGIVERVDADGTLHTIEGNSSDQVARRVHTAAGVVGYVRLTATGH